MTYFTFLHGTVKVLVHLCSSKTSAKISPARRLCARLFLYLQSLESTRAYEPTRIIIHRLSLPFHNKYLSYSTAAPTPQKPHMQNPTPSANKYMREPNTTPKNHNCAAKAVARRILSLPILARSTPTSREEELACYLPSSRRRFFS